MSKIEKISIVTACCRPSNLDTIYKSIQFDLIHKWYIVYDTSKNRSYEKIYRSHPKIIELECSDVGIAGNPVRNLAISLIDDGFIYFLDDDNIIHPDFWTVVPSLDIRNFYTWDQLRNKDGDDTDWQMFINEKGKILRGNALKVRHIDTAQMFLPRHLIGDLRWKDHEYKADGMFIESLNKIHPLHHVYIPKVLCYYNFL
jgi:hypothetical protein